MSSDESENENVIWEKGSLCQAEWDGAYYDAKIADLIKTPTGCKEALVEFRAVKKSPRKRVAIASLRKRPAKNDSANRDDSDVTEVAYSMFSPTRHEEEKKRLIEKFRVQEYEEMLENESRKANKGWNTTRRKLVSPTHTLKRSESQDSWQSKSSPKTPKRRGIVAKGGQAISNRNTQKKSTESVVKSVSSIMTSPSPKMSELLAKTSPLTSDVSPVPSVPVVSAATSRSAMIRSALSSSDEENADTVTTSPKHGFSDTDMERPFFPNISPSCRKEPLVLSEPGVQPVIQVPPTINRYLRDYQREGVRFLYKHFAASHGAILADDMGLGKTIQVISFIAAVLCKTGTKIDVMRQQPSFIRRMSSNAALYEPPKDSKPFLIIGPASVLYNWVDELTIWGHFKIGRFHKQHKEETISELRRNKLDVVVTTFETCRDHIETLNVFEWEAIIADEAHKIKGLKAEVTKALKTFTCRKRYGLTGTPLQNQLQELWCIMDWANPKCLGSLRKFEDRYIAKITEGQKHEATKRELAEARTAQDKLGKIRSKWMLRRTKAIIADQLPKKEELIVYCPMAELQADVYETIMSCDDMQFILTCNEPCTCGSDNVRRRCCFRKTPDGRKIRDITFTYMHLLLKTANHIALLLPSNTNSEKQADYAKAICKKVFEKHQQFVEQAKRASFRTLSDPKYCGKMKVLAGLLSVFRKQKSKILLFSYSTRLLDILEQYVMTKSFEYRRLDGNTPEVKRVQIVREFNRDPSLFIFLISTKAGGIGLNLTGANVVIIFDPNWNPTHDLQAQDRAYRLGQLRDVKVYRLICAGTIEENIYLRQVYKQQKATEAIDSEYARRYFNEGELFGVHNMFRLRKSDRCLTEDILARQRKMEDALKAFRVEKYIPSERESQLEQEATHQQSNLDLSDPDPDSSSQGEDSNEEDIHNSQEPSTSKASPKPIKRKQGRAASLVKNKVLKYTEDPFVDSEITSSSEENTSKTSDKAVKRKLMKNRNVRIKQRNMDVNFGDNLGSSSDEMNTRLRSNLGDKEFEEEGERISKRRLKHSRRTSTSSTRKGEGHAMDEGGDLEKAVGLDRMGGGRRRRASDVQEERAKAVPQTLATYQSVSEVLEHCGVRHTHENRAIVGGSKVEEHISRTAMRDVYELHQHSQMPAANCEPYSQSSEESDDLGASLRESEKIVQTKKVVPPNPSNKEKATSKTTTKSRSKEDGGSEGKTMPALEDKSWSEKLGNRKVLGGQTPKAIQMQQFKAMAIAQSVRPVELARQILLSNQEQRLATLRHFYVTQDATLEAVTSEKFVAAAPSPQTIKGNRQQAKRKASSEKKIPSKQKIPGNDQRRRKVTKKRGIAYEDNDQNPAEASKDMPDLRLQDLRCPANKRSSIEERVQLAHSLPHGDTSITQPRDKNQPIPIQRSSPQNSTPKPTDRPLKRVYQHSDHKLQCNVSELSSANPPQTTTRPIKNDRSSVLNQSCGDLVSKGSFGAIGDASNAGKIGDPGEGSCWVSAASNATGYEDGMVQRDAGGGRGSSLMSRQVASEKSFFSDSSNAGYQESISDGGGETSDAGHLSREVPTSKPHARLQSFTNTSTTRMRRPYHDSRNDAKDTSLWNKRSKNDPVTGSEFSDHKDKKDVPLRHKRSRNNNMTNSELDFESDSRNRTQMKDASLRHSREKNESSITAKRVDAPRNTKHIAARNSERNPTLKRPLPVSPLSASISSYSRHSSGSSSSSGSPAGMQQVGHRHSCLLAVPTTPASGQQSRTQKHSFSPPSSPPPLVVPDKNAPPSAEKLLLKNKQLKNTLQFLDDVFFTD